MAKAESGLLGEDAGTTVGEYLGWWMENVVRNDVSHRTYHNYLFQVRNHILPALGKKKLQTLKLEDMEGLYRSMSASGLSSATVRYAHAVLRRALKQAVVRGLVTRNAAEGASLPRMVQKETQTFTPEEARRFLQAASGDRLGALYVLAVTCGCRQGELLGLRWEDVDLGAGKLTVRRQVQRSRDGSGMVTGPTKNKKSRTIRLGTVAVEALRAHRERQSGEVDRAKGLWGDPDLVFASTIGTVLDPSNVVDRSFKPLLRRAGLPNIRFHDLRHACATPAPPYFSPKEFPSRWCRRSWATPASPSLRTCTPTSCPTCRRRPQRRWTGCSRTTGNCQRDCQESPDRPRGLSLLHVFRLSIGISESRRADSNR